MTSKMRKAAGIKSKSECVKVIVRIRPLSHKERANGNQEVGKVDSENATISVHDPNNNKANPKQFTFDRTYGPNCKQTDIYNQIAAPVVEDVLKGFNGTIFAYGQTGAGKTFTMEGVMEDPNLRGIIPNTFRHIFDKIAVNTSSQRQFLVRASYLEIYNEEIRDLLSRDTTRKLEVMEDIDRGVYVEDLTARVVKSVAEISDVLKAGKKNRSVGATLMNQTSSRSHSIFTIVVETSDIGIDGKPHFTVGKLNLVDLAGSERQAKTQAQGQRLKEATKINLSLSALGNVISALVDGKSSHIPYRDSKLTRLLQDSLGGNTKTVMCANCGPADYNYDETLSTLRYANRAKQIKNKPKINEDPKDAMLREFQEEIMRLRAQLAGRGGEGGSNGESKHSSGSRRRKKGGRTIVEEKIVIKREGIEKDIFEQLKNKSREEQDRIMQDLAEKKRRIEMKKVKTEQEAKELEKRLREEERQRMETLQRQREIEDKLKEVEKKVFMGGEELDRASAEAREFKRKKIELKEQKRREELMARQLAAQEEANIMIQEEYASLHEEAHDKTQKLKKLYTKYQQQKSEVKDLQEEFNRERETILEDIRMLNKQLKLNEFILQRYVPEDAVKRIEKWATYDEVKDAWSIRRLDYAGNNQKRFQKRVRDNASSGTTSPLSTDHLYFQYDKDSESGISVMRRRKKKSVSSSSDVDLSKKKLKKKKKKKSSRKKKERYRDGK